MNRASLEQQAAALVAHGDDRCDERDEALAQFHALPQHREARPAPAAALRRPCIAFIPASELLSTIAPTDWLIRGHVPADSLVLIYGDPETGKSFLALGLACGCVSGQDVYGLKIKRQGPVLVIIGEGRNRYAARIAAWSLHHRKAVHGLPLHVSTMATELTSEVVVAELQAVIAEFMREHGAPAMVVVDTLARNFGAADENSTADMGRAIAACDLIREQTKAAVVLVHHSGKDSTKGARGSMALRGAVDVEFRMTRDGDMVRFDCTKMKDAERSPSLAFRFERVPLGIQDDEGEDETSAVLTPLDADEAGPLAAPGRVTGKNQRLALGILQELYAGVRANLRTQGRDEDAGSVSVEGWREQCTRGGLNRNRFHEAKQALIGSSAIRIELGHVYLQGEGA